MPDNDAPSHYVSYLVCQPLGDEAVVRNLASGKYYGFDDVATRM